MKKTALLLMLFSVLMKLIGFSREILISYYYGASDISDAYLIALTVPGTIFTVIGAGIITGFIPMYSRIERDDNTVTADHFTSDFINFILLCCAILVLVIYLFTKPIIHLFAFGFEGEVLDLAVKFTRICTLSVFFTGIVSVYNGYLQVKRRFLLPVLMSIPFNICIILSILLSYHYDIRLLAYGSVAAELAQFLFLIPFLYHIGFRHKLKMEWKNRYLKQIIRLSVPIIFGVSINQINILVDKTIASKLMEGGISALNYAGKLSGTIQGIFITSVVAVLFPAISQLAAQNNLIEMKNYIQRTIIAIQIILVPATVGMIIFAKPIVTLLYGRGAFDTAVIQITSLSFLCYAIGMLGFGLREILSRAFYALRNTRIPMVNALIGILINIILNLILSKYMGIAGLALATSISACITTILLLIALRRRVGNFVQRAGYYDMIKLLLASFLMGISARICFDLLCLRVGQNKALLIAAFLGALLYFLLIKCLKVSYATEFLKSVLEKNRRLKERTGILFAKNQMKEKQELENQENENQVYENQENENQVIVYRENENQENENRENESQEKLNQEKLNQEKLNQEKLNQEILNQEKLNQEKLNQEKLNQEILHQEKLNQEKKDLDKEIDGKQRFNRTEELTKSRTSNPMDNRRTTQLVGIIVVTDNNPKGLRRILEQISRQTFHRYRVFIIDVGSNVEEEDAIYDMLRRNQHYYYCRLSYDTGHAGGFYHGMIVAYEEGMTSVWFLEDHMLLHPYALQALMNENQDRSRRVCLCSNEIDSKKRINEIRNQEKKRYQVECDAFLGAMLPSKIIEEIRVPDAKIYHGFDEKVYFLKMIEIGYIIYRVRDSLITDPKRSYPES